MYGDVYFMLRSFWVFDVCFGRRVRSFGLDLIRIYLVFLGLGLD